MLKFILYIILGYFLFRFITGFVIPVFRTGKQIKRQFNDMQQRMEEQMRQQQAAAANNAPQAEKQSPATPVGDYIDFEEVK
ncbi:MAG: hypothetical protein J0I84_17560 [Terrimonas sp.]|nr:hypothetical protein [Terrimonas sp.]OJY87875.1 MAG: hypothetical protein BGP13_05495 [Sphingobacteriales bacterium 40-81]